MVISKVEGGMEGVDIRHAEFLEATALRGHFRLLILSLLEKSVMRGYQVLKKIEEIVGYRPKLSTIYTLLKELEEIGLIHSYKGGQGDTKVYSITEKGRNVLSHIRRNSREKFEEVLNRIFHSGKH